jgi:hypothetical protein
MTTQRGLRRGDLVEVVGPSEILATLDENGAVGGLPFMPEMVQYCGQRFVVDCRADKVCDTVKYTGSLRLADTVLLGALRCNGSRHGGCQADCRLFWKEAWLRSVTESSPTTAPYRPQELNILAQHAALHVKRTGQVEGHLKERWVCQLTEMFKAGAHLSVWDPRPYLNEYANGNVTLGHCLRVSARAAIEEPMRRLGLMPIFVKGTAVRAPAYESSNLQPGDWVQVRSMEEIIATLNPKGQNRGLSFDREMVPYCGRIFRVRQRISRFIDDCQDNGRMVEMATDAVTLEGAVCSGELSQQRWFCPRRIFPYWRECWLRRVPSPAPQSDLVPEPVTSEGAAS